MTAITDKDIKGASILSDAAPDIIFAAEAALLARGVDDASEVMAALLAAAWHKHKEIAGGKGAGPFVQLVRGWLDAAEAMDRPN